MAKNIILISGGPGLFNDKDIEHDKSWANYVTPPLLKWDADPAKLTGAGNTGLEVWWLVFKPAYVDRWNDDVDKGRPSVDGVKKKGFSSYVDMLEHRAADRGWKLRWFDSATRLWQLLWTFSENIVRLWYWGHARNDLWLTLGHSASTAVMPSGDTVVKVADIALAKNKLRATVEDDPSIPNSRFVGCNTEEFAIEWSKTYKTRSEGVRGKIEFSGIHASGGDPSLVSTAKIVIVDNTGSTSDTTTWAAMLFDPSPERYAASDDATLDPTHYSEVASYDEPRRALGGGATVVIDAGHGGSARLGGATPIGAVGARGTRERDVNLAIARMLAERLGARAVLTRSDDRSLSLGERVAIARNAGAKVFVSIHANSGESHDHGPETWIHTEASPRSRALAHRIQSSLTRLSGDGRGVMAGPLGVLSPDHHAPGTAACLVETDFLSHPERERRLSDPQQQAAIADALASAVRAFMVR